MKPAWIIALIAMAAMMVLAVRSYVGRDLDDTAATPITSGAATAIRFATAGPAAGGNVSRRAPVDREPPRSRSELEPPEHDSNRVGERAPDSAEVVRDSGRGAAGNGGAAHGAAPGGGIAAAGTGAAAKPDAAKDRRTSDDQPAAPAPSARAEGDRETPPVLLSIPLKGSVDSAQGDSPTKAEGVVIGDDAVEFTADAQYTLPAGGHVDGRQGSIDFEIEPRWAGSDETNNSLLQIRDADNWANSLQIMKNLDSLRFVIVDSAGVQSDVVVDISDWPADQARRITATWSDSAMILYVDGEPVGQSPLTAGPKFKSTTPIHVGSDFPGSQFGSADGRISNLAIYGRPLVPGDLK